MCNNLGSSFELAVLSIPLIIKWWIILFVRWLYIILYTCVDKNKHKCIITWDACCMALCIAFVSTSYWFFNCSYSLHTASETRKDWIELIFLRETLCTLRGDYQKLNMYLSAILATSALSPELAIATRYFPFAVVDIFYPDPYVPWSLQKKYVLNHNYKMQSFNI